MPPSVYRHQLGDKRIYGRPPRRKLDPMRRGSQASAIGSEADGSDHAPTRNREEAHVWKQYVMVHAPPPSLTSEDILRGKQHLQVQLFVRREASPDRTGVIGAGGASAATSVDGTAATSLSQATTVESTAGAERLGTLLINAGTTLEGLRDICSRQYRTRCPIAFYFAAKRNGPADVPTPECQSPQAPNDMPSPLYIDALHTIPFEEEGDLKVVDVADPVPVAEGDAAPLVQHFRLVILVPAADVLSQTDISHFC